MPPPHKPRLPPPAEPKYGRPFDPWNSASSGHQVAESQGPQGWRESRTVKLQHQFAAGHSGGKWLSDTVEAKAAYSNGGCGMPPVPKAVSTSATNNNVVDMLLGQRGPAEGRQRHFGVTPFSRSPSTRGEPAGKNSGSWDRGAMDGHVEASGVPAAATMATHETGADAGAGRATEQTQPRIQTPAATRGRKIFDGVVVYVNGSTHPLISDHKLKRLLAEHGARTSIHLGRRQVTHVIVGKPARTTTGLAGGAGGGLAAGKLEKEICRGRGACPVKILESVKAGKRLSEARFAHLKVAAKGQPSVLSAFSNTGGGK